MSSPIVRPPNRRRFWVRLALALLLVGLLAALAFLIGYCGTA